MTSSSVLNHQEIIYAYKILVQSKSKQLMLAYLMQGVSCIFGYEVEVFFTAALYNVFCFDILPKSIINISSFQIVLICNKAYLLHYNLNK